MHIVGKFSRAPDHRHLMFRTTVSQLIMRERVETTRAKAKELARLTDKVVTWGKKNTHATYWKARGYVTIPESLPKLFNDLAQRYADRPGGYTRVFRLNNRYTTPDEHKELKKKRPYYTSRRDDAEMAVVELVDNGLPPLVLPPSYAAKRAAMEAEKVKAARKLAAQFPPKQADTASEL
eukprot:Opistho-2@14442